MIQKILKDFLLEINQDDNWVELVLEIELQPAYFGISGYCINDRIKEISLRTRTNHDFDKNIKDYHLNNSDKENRWNKIKFSLKNSIEESLSLIWDQTWQNEIDKLNIEAKKKNTEYNLPKWHWEA